jgi:hypothetical protein
MFAEYCYSYDGENFSGSCSTVEDALYEAIDNGDGGEEGFWIGESVRFKAGDFFCLQRVEDLLDNLAEDAGEECGEASEDWLNFYPDWRSFSPEMRQAEIVKHRQSLEPLRDDIRAAINNWADKTGRHPHFWSVKNVQYFSRADAEAMV